MTLPAFLAQLRLDHPQIARDVERDLALRRPHLIPSLLKGAGVAIPREVLSELQNCMTVRRKA
jgi:hypothetical protein